MAITLKKSNKIDVNLFINLQKAHFFRGLTSLNQIFSNKVKNGSAIQIANTCRHTILSKSDETDTRSIGDINCHIREIFKE